MSDLKRYFIEISFKGTPFHGWQVQPNAITVQEKLNEALSTVLRQTIETLGCGRTDTGVHARQFYAHFDLGMRNEQSEMSSQKSSVSSQQSVVSNQKSDLRHLLSSINSILPFDIAVKRFIEVTSESHARFDATVRTYEYHINFNKDPFKHDLSWFLRDKPDIERMNAAAAIIKEYTDFSCFSKSNTQVFTNNCKISKAEWVWQGDSLVFYISADRFLRNMVRAIVGTLVSIGRGEAEPESVRDVIESKDRSNAGTSVPACGLYLTEVIYPYINQD